MKRLRRKRSPMGAVAKLKLTMKSTSKPRRSRYEEHPMATIKNLSLCGAIDGTSVGPFTLGFTCDDLNVLCHQHNWWEEPIVKSYVLCVAWCLRYVGADSVLVDASFGQTVFEPSFDDYVNISHVIAPTFVGVAGGGHWALLTIDKKNSKISIITSASAKRIFVDESTYEKHIKGLLTLTGWAEYDDVGWSKHATRSSHSQKEKTWVGIKVAIKSNGSSCGPVMCHALCGEVVSILEGLSFGRDQFAEFKFEEFVNFKESDFRLGTMWHMGMILESMTHNQAYRVENDVFDFDSVKMSVDLLRMEFDALKKLVDADFVCVCGLPVDIKREKVVVSSPYCCHIRYHFGCFAEILHAVESSEALGQTIWCGQCKLECCYVYCVTKGVPDRRLIVSCEEERGDMGVPPIFLQDRVDVRKKLVDFLVGGPVEPLLVVPAGGASVAASRSVNVDRAYFVEQRRKRELTKQEEQMAAKCSADDVDDQGTLPATQDTASDDDFEVCDDAFKSISKLLGTQDDEAGEVGDDAIKSAMALRDTQDTVSDEGVEVDDDATQDTAAARKKEVSDRNRNAEVPKRKTLVHRRKPRDDDALESVDSKRLRISEDAADGGGGKQVDVPVVVDVDPNSKRLRISEDSSDGAGGKQGFVLPVPVERSVEERRLVEERRTLLRRKEAKDRGVRLQEKMERRRTENGVQFAAPEQPVPAVIAVAGSVPSRLASEQGVEGDILDEPTDPSSDPSTPVHQVVECPPTYPSPDPSSVSEGLDAVAHDQEADASGNVVDDDVAPVAVADVAPVAVVAPSAVVDDVPGGVRILTSTNDGRECFAEYRDPFALDMEKGSSAYLLEFGCVTFAIAGEQRVRELQFVLERLFVPPPSQNLQCHDCGAKARSRVMLLWHQELGCKSFETPLLSRWSPTTLLFFHVSIPLLARMDSTVTIDRLDLIDPNQFPMPCGKRSKHRADFYGLEITKEKTLHKNKNDDMFVYYAKKQLFLKGKPRASRYDGAKEVFNLCFLKHPREWPGWLRNQYAITPLAPPGDDVL